MIAAAPVDAPAESYLHYIEHIPPEDGPQMFGMHVSVSGCVMYAAQKMVKGFHYSLRSSRKFGRLV